MKDNDITIAVPITNELLLCMYLPEILMLGAAILVTAGIAFVGEWIVQHPIVGVPLFGIIVTMCTYIKISNVFSKDASCKPITIAFSLLYVLVISIFAFMYLVPLWFYYGGIYSVFETIGCIVLFCIIFFLLKYVFKRMLKRVNEGPQIAICDFFSALFTIVLLYIINLDGIRCYLFDYIGVMAPFM